MQFLRVLWLRGWPVTFVVIGLVLLLPRGPQTRIEPVVRVLLTTVVGQLLTLRTETVEASAIPQVDPVIASRLAEWGSPVLPPEQWGAGGVFQAIPVGEHRQTESIRLWTDAEFESNQPVVVGEVEWRRGRLPVLVGFTRFDPTRGRDVRPITSSGMRLGALAGDPDTGRVVRFRAEGDGTNTLQVLRPDARTQLRDGDLVWIDPQWASSGWTSTWTPPAGVRLFLGVLRIDPDEPQWKMAHRVEVFARPQSLTMVAVRRPSSQSHGEDQPSWCEAAIRRLADEPARDGLWLAEGREEGVVRGLDVVFGSAYYGQIESAGWGTCRVRAWWTVHREWSVLVVDEAGVTAARLRPISTRGASVVVNLRPEAARRQGAVVVTAPGSRLLEPGMRFGRLDLCGGWVVERPQAPQGQATIVLSGGPP